MGASVDGTKLLEQTVIAKAGEVSVLRFAEQLKAVITPETITIGGESNLVVSLEIYEFNPDGEAVLIEDPQLLLEEASHWNLKIQGAPSGKLYRMTVQAQSLDG